MKKKLSILFVSTTYPQNNNDWRGRFMANLVTALATINMDINFWGPPGEFPQNLRYTPGEFQKKYLAKLMQKGGIAHQLKNSRVSGFFSALLLLSFLFFYYRKYQEADVAHINWLQNALPLAGTKTPAIVTVLGKDYALLKSKLLTKLLHHIFSKRACIIAPNASWMVPRLKELFGDVADIKTIPFGINEMWFGLDRQPEKTNKRSWICVTRITGKKIGALFDWGDSLFQGDRFLQLFGPLQERINVPRWIDYCGPVTPDELCLNYFPKATGFISLSQHDEGRPQAILEAMASGLPIIASDIPAHRDLIKHCETGMLVSSRQELEEALVFLEDPKQNRKIGNTAREWVKINQGTWMDCANKFKIAYMGLAKYRED